VTRCALLTLWGKMGDHHGHYEIFLPLVSLLDLGFALLLNFGAQGLQGFVIKATKEIRV